MWFKLVAISVQAETTLPRDHLLHHSLLHGPPLCSIPHTEYPYPRTEYSFLRIFCVLHASGNKQDQDSRQSTYSLHLTKHVQF